MFSWQQQTMQDLTAPGCSTGTSPALCALEDIEFARSDYHVAYAVAMSSSNGCPGGPCALQVYTTTEADLNAGAFWLNVTGNLGLIQCHTGDWNCYRSYSCKYSLFGYLWLYSGD